MRTLDLKFVAHHGEFIKHRMAGREELAGRDVILVHRFLKNSVNERLGGHAYALYSDPCIRAMGIDPAAQGLVEHRESIDIIGEVTCWVRDLEDAWEKENARERIEVPRDNAALFLEYDIAAPRSVVWEHLTHPGHRPKWQGSDEVREMTETGRRGVGTVHAVIDGPDPAPAVLRCLAHLVRRPPFRPKPGLGEMLPHRRTRCGDVELDDGCRSLAGHLVHLPVFFLLPSRFEVAHPDDDVVDAGDAVGHAYHFRTSCDQPRLSLLPSSRHSPTSSSPGVTRGSRRPGRARP
jgi:hypothetical protein